MSIEPQNDDDGALAIIGYILTLADAAHYYGVGAEAGWLNQISDKTVVTTSSFQGNPDRFSQGFPVSSTQTTIYSDAYIDFIQALLGGTYSTIVEETYDSYSSMTELVAIPSYSKTTKRGPVVVTLDWDVALVDPAEAKPIRKYYNIIEGSRGAYGLMINHACTSIIANFSRHAIWTMQVYSPHNSGGQQLIQKWLVEAGGTYNSSLMDAVRYTEERTGLLQHISSRMDTQLFRAFDYRTITMIKAQGVSSADAMRYGMMMRQISKYDRLKVLCTNNPTKVINTEISKKVTKYNIRGPATTITTVSTSLNEAGGTSQVLNQEQTVLSESVVKMASPLKRNLSWPTGSDLEDALSAYNVIYSRVQIPTTNWEDLKRVYNACPTKIIQGSKSYKFVADSVNGAISAFYSSIREKGIRTASMSFDCIKGQGTYDVSYTKAYSGMVTS